MGTGLYPVSSTGAASRYIAGGILGTYVGFGLGHAVHGTWREIGWLFTYGELMAVGSITTGMVMTDGDLNQSELAETMVISGFLVWGGLRIWQTLDVWLRPIIKGYIGQPTSRPIALMPWVGPDTQGLALTTNF